MLLNENHYRLILAMADYNMNAFRAIESVGIGQTTGQRYFEDIEAETGLNPKCFWDLVDLQEFAGKVVAQRQKIVGKNVAQHHKK